MRGDKRMISSLNTLRNPGVLWLILVRLQNTDSELPLKSVTRWLVGLAHQSKNHTGYINNLHSKVFQGFLLDSAVNNPPANAEDVGLIPDLGRSHTPWSNWARGLQISIPGSRAREPQLLSTRALEPMVSNKRGHSNRKPKPCDEG